MVRTAKEELTPLQISLRTLLMQRPSRFVVKGAIFYGRKSYLDILSDIAKSYEKGKRKEIAIYRQK